MTPPSADIADLDAQDRERLALMTALEETGAYMKIQGTWPQTLAYSLTDSPVRQFAWLAAPIARPTASRWRRLPARCAQQPGGSGGSIDLAD